MSFIIEIKEKREIKIGERFDSRPNPYQRQEERIDIMEEQIFLVLKQEVEKLDIKGIVKLINKIE